MSETEFIEHRNYDAIDLMKFIAALLVVALHTDAFYDVNHTLYVMVCDGISRLAVPFFFIASAFFLYLPNRGGGTLSKERSIKYIKRLAVLYASWFIVYIPLTIYNKFYLSSYPLKETIFRYVRSLFFSGGFSGGWYLTSCVFCTWLFSVIDSSNLSKNVKQHLVIGMSAIIYLFCVVTSGYSVLMDRLNIRKAYDLYELLFCQPYLSIIVGVPYFAIGKYMAAHDDCNPPAWVCAVTFVLYIVEMLLVDKFKLGGPINHYFLLLPCVVLLFAKVKRSTVKIKYARLLRSFSTVIYLSQFIWIFMMEFIEWVFKITLTQTEKYIFVLLLCFAASAVISGLKNRNGFKWLGKLA